MPDFAFKEWAVVCRALAAGAQSIILRKGGISEVGGEFQPEHAHFWLYPTYLHEHRAGVKPEYHALFDEAERDRPSPGIVRLQHRAAVTAIRYLSQWEEVAAISHRHIWSEQAVRKKFDYRRPGLYLLETTIESAANVIDLAETSEMAGCRTWVPLDVEAQLPTQRGAS